MYVDVGEHKKRLRDVGELVGKLGHHAYSQRVEGLAGLQACCVIGALMVPLFCLSNIE